MIVYYIPTLVMMLTDWQYWQCSSDKRRKQKKDIYINGDITDQLNVLHRKMVSHID